MVIITTTPQRPFVLLFDFNLHPSVRIYQNLLYLLTRFFVRSSKLFLNPCQKVFLPYQLILAPAGCQMALTYPFLVCPALFLSGSPLEILAAVCANNLSPEVVGFTILKHYFRLRQNLLNLIPKFSTHNTFMGILHIVALVFSTLFRPMRKQVSVGGFLNLAVTLVYFISQVSGNCGCGQLFLTPQGGKTTRLEFLRNLLKDSYIHYLRLLQRRNK